MANKNQMRVRRERAQQIGTTRQARRICERKAKQAARAAEEARVAEEARTKSKIVD